MRLTIVVPIRLGVLTMRGVLGVLLATVVTMGTVLCAQTLTSAQLEQTLALLLLRVSTLKGVTVVLVMLGTVGVAFHVKTLMNAVWGTVDVLRCVLTV